MNRKMAATAALVLGAVLAGTASAEAPGGTAAEAEAMVRKGMAYVWQDFTFLASVNKKVEPKQMYCEIADDRVVCGGIYKAGT